MQNTSYRSQENENIKPENNSILNDTIKDSNDILIQNQTLSVDDNGNNDKYKSWYQ
jgi:hypothetical protein